MSATEYLPATNSEPASKASSAPRSGGGCVEPCLRVCLREKAAGLAGKRHDDVGAAHDAGAADGDDGQGRAARHKPVVEEHFLQRDAGGLCIGS